MSHLIPCLRRICLVLSLCVIGPLVAHADDTASVAWDIDAKVLSDVRSRGVSDSMGRPGAKLAVQAAHESGLIGLIEFTTVSKKQFLNGAGLGLVAATGYRFGDPDAWHFGLGLVGEFFPGASFDAPNAINPETFETSQVRRTNYDSHFLLAEVAYGALEGRLLNVISRTYRGSDSGGVCGQILQVSTDPAAGLACYARGVHDSRGTLLTDLSYHYDLTPSTRMNLHVGHQRVKHFREADTTDYAWGVTHRRWGFEFSVERLSVSTKERAVFLIPDGTGQKVTDDNAWVISASHKF